MFYCDSYILPFTLKQKDVLMLLKVVFASLHSPAPHLCHVQLRLSYLAVFLQKILGQKFGHCFSAPFIF